MINAFTFLPNFLQVNDYFQDKIYESYNKYRKTGKYETFSLIMKMEDDLISNDKYMNVYKILDILELANYHQKTNTTFLNILKKRYGDHIYNEYAGDDDLIYSLKLFNEEDAKRFLKYFEGKSIEIEFNFDDMVTYGLSSNALKIFINIK